MSTDESEELVVPVIEEEIAAGVKAVRTGAVRVDKHVEKRLRKVEGPLLHEDVEVRRVPVGRVVSEPPAVRRKGDTVIVPVVEEELVVTKRLCSKRRSISSSGARRSASPRKWKSIGSERRCIGWMRTGVSWTGGRGRRDDASPDYHRGIS